MKKLKMIRKSGLTFEEGCNLYLNNCKERNLRQGTINHNSFVLFLKSTLNNDVTNIQKNDIM